MANPPSITRPVSRRAVLALAGLLVIVGPSRANGPLVGTALDAPSIQTAEPAARPEAETERRPLGGAVGGSLPPGAAATSSDWRWAQTLATLAGVIALILTTRAVFQRLGRRSGGLAASLGPAGRAPSGLLEVLARFPVSRGLTLVLLRMDRRVLLLSQSASGFRTLADVSDPDEVASLLIKSRDDEGATSAARFNDLLRQMERDPALIAEERSGEDAGTDPGPVSQRLARLRGIRA
jgi:flagellar biogenesis protein FliO